jgi:uncharacterized protein YjlB
MEMSVVSADLEPLTFVFEDDGSCRTIRCRFWSTSSAVDVGNDHPEKTIEGLFGANGWGDMWRNGIYDYLHYHATVHEVLGVARGHARVRFGGDKGKELEIAPATSPSCPPAPGINAFRPATISAWSAPIRRDPKMQITRPTPENHAKALKTIPQVKLPKTDPVMGATGRW